MSVRIAYEDRWLVVLDKPSGLPTQSPRGGGDNLYDRLLALHPTAALHHRLDVPTSGLVLFTIEPVVNRAVTEAFRSHGIERTYLTVLSGHASSGRWTTPVERRTARTTIEVLGHRGSTLTAARCRLHTGRRHQIRVHAAMNGTPVLGDRRYDPEGYRAWPRLALHAASLCWTHPVTGAPLEVTSPVPDDLQPLWSQLVTG